MVYNYLLVKVPKKRRAIVACIGTTAGEDFIGAGGVLKNDAINTLWSFENISELLDSDVFEKPLKSATINDFFSTLYVFMRVKEAIDDIRFKYSSVGDLRDAFKILGFLSIVLQSYEEEEIEVEVISGDDNLEWQVNKLKEQGYEVVKI